MTPRLLTSGGWRVLLDATATQTASVPLASVACELPRPLQRFTLRLLRVLAMVPFSPWRTTCLYRSVAICVLLRRRGVPAVLRLGASADAGIIAAHAWIEHVDGRVLYEQRRDFQPLQ